MEGDIQECATCHGIGFLSYGATDIYDSQFGKVYDCNDCGKPVEDMRRDFGLVPGPMQSKTFDSLMDIPPSVEPVVSAARAMAMGDADFKWLVMAGTVGWAKTHIGFAILNARVAHPEWGPAGRYVSCPDYLDELRNGYNDGSYAAVMEQYRSMPLLMLDDLGAYHQRGDEGMTWAEEKVYQLLNHRITEELETIITINIPQEKMEPRVRDRVMDTGTGLVKVFGLALPSYRTGEVRA